MATKRSVGTLSEADLKGKKVFLRADLNVPLDDSQKITDDTRIRASVPTIKFLMEKGAKVILASHLGRPKGVTPKYSLKPLVPRLSELLGVNVVMANDCIGEEVQKLAASLPDGGVLLLENVRAHASTEGVTKYLKPAVAGFLMQKELDYLVGAVANPKKPFAAIVGGSKVSTKIGVIESLLAKVDILILGGGMIFTFYKAQGHAAIAKKLAEITAKGVTTIIGGGDSVADVEKAGLADKMSHISTGGGASLELLEGKTLPGVLALDDA
ncbi:phosphoglycerate kinase 1, chloroplastic-like [Panicum miliaceum]|uniref:Phosphoglycerate kinase n=1 Tax=Panicum miliaceum TaxID=4540 RepID=A0A3L6RZD3_PANMI|nr:phosphoglycerate kinase 1, chloroplastic-like [Panicum miliaceum]